MSSTITTQQNRSNWNGYDQQGTLTSLRQASQDTSVPEQYRQPIREACFALEQMQGQIQQQIQQTGTSGSMAAGAGGGLNSDINTTKGQGQPNSSR